LLSSVQVNETPSQSYTGRYLSHGITQWYLPPNTSEHPALTQARGRYLIYLPRRDGRLSWPWWTVTYRDG